MKQIILGLVLTLGIANAWSCEAYANDGAYGYGVAPSYNQAWNMALSNCIYYKNPYAVCRVTDCW